MKLNEKETAVFKKWLMNVLSNGEATVKFTKKDGTARTMRCTTKASLLPTFEIKEGSEQKKERKVNDEIMCVFDLEASTWKSFRWDSVKKVEASL